MTTTRLRVAANVPDARKPEAVPLSARARESAAGLSPAAAAGPPPRRTPAAEKRPGRRPSHPPPRAAAVRRPRHPPPRCGSARGRAPPARARASKALELIYYYEECALVSVLQTVQSKIPD